MLRNTLAGLIAIPLVAAPVASFAAGADHVWKAFGGDGESASIMVLNKADVDNPEAHYSFFMSCAATDQWMMNISDIDAKALGGAISDGKQPSFTLMLDGKPGGEGDGAYFPEIVYNQMDSVWEYSTSWDMSLLDELLKVGKIGVTGTGVNVTLPTEGMTEALQEFKGSCEALEATDEEEPAPDDVPPDNGADTPDSGTSQ